MGDLVLVRHGRTAFNASGRLQGRVDNPLDEEGERQAALLADALAPVLRADSLIVSSPLVRARRTAEVVASVVGPSVTIDERWIELDYGVLDGVAQRDVPAAVWSAWRSDPGFAPEGGESLLDVRRRVESALTELIAATVDRDVVVVSHVSPIKAAVTAALGADDRSTWRMHLDTASVCRLVRRERGFAVRSFNETHHLVRDRPTWGGPATGE